MNAIHVSMTRSALHSDEHTYVLYKSENSRMALFLPVEVVLGGQHRYCIKHYMNAM